jgi:hypothetical protein
VPFRAYREGREVPFGRRGRHPGSLSRMSPKSRTFGAGDLIELEVVAVTQRQHDAVVRLEASEGLLNEDAVMTARRVIG